MVSTVQRKLKVIRAVVCKALRLVCGLCIARPLWMVDVLMWVCFCSLSGGLVYPAVGLQRTRVLGT